MAPAPVQPSTSSRKLPNTELVPPSLNKIKAANDPTGYLHLDYEPIFEAGYSLSLKKEELKRRRLL
jgi:hypothetical protein